MILETWQERQKEWRRVLFDADISQTDFAEKHGFNKPLLSQWLNGKRRPGAEGEKRMIEALNTIKSEAQSTT